VGRCGGGGAAAVGGSGAAPGGAGGERVGGAGRREDRAVEDLAEDLAGPGCRLGVRPVTAGRRVAALRCGRCGSRSGRSAGRGRAAGGRADGGEGSPRLGESQLELAAPLSLWCAALLGWMRRFARAVAVVGPRPRVRTARRSRPSLVGLASRCRPGGPPGQYPHRAP
jgi:hypothetical protein